MTIGKWLAVTALCLVAATAHAHAHLTDSDPREGSTGKAPARIVLTFSEAARLTTITLGKEGTEARKLAPPTEMGVRLTVLLPALGIPGARVGTVECRVEPFGEAVLDQ